MGNWNMSSLFTAEPNQCTVLPLPAFWLEQRWYAAYTRAQHEKSVAAELGMREVEHFLPLYSSVRRGKDRRVTLESPLFPGKVFVWLGRRGGVRVGEIPRVVRLVGFYIQTPEAPHYVKGM